MAEETLTDTDGDEDFVIIEQQAGEDTASAATGDDTVPAGDGNDTVPAADADDDDGDDDRLGANEEEAEQHEADGRKKKRRERQRLAREAATRELEELRAFKMAAEPRLAALEANTLGLNQTTLEQQIAFQRDRAQQAENIRRAAEEAGNASDVYEALRIRDEANAQLQQLQPALDNIKRLREQGPGPQQQQPVDHMAAWIQHNPWYRDGGMDENSVYARHVANEVLKGGQHGDIKMLGFWQEVTRRLNGAGGLTTMTEDKPAPQQQEKPGRKAPPVGTTREVTAASGQQREIVLTPDEVHAIKEAGLWDDPKDRMRMAKRYHDQRRAAGQ